MSDQQPAINDEQDEKDEFAKRLEEANKAALAGDQDLANDLIDQILDQDRDKIK